MNQRSFYIEDLKINIRKYKTSRRIKLTINSSAQINISIPIYCSYQEGLNFAQSKMDWIKKRKPNKRFYQNNSRIGKNHYLKLKPENIHKCSSILGSTEIIIKHPLDLDPKSEAVQDYIKNISKKVLKREACQLLPQRLEKLSQKHNILYKQLKIRNLKSRWGSCNSQQIITLNQNLLELPWQLIDYVIVHELIHTKIMNHSKSFWNYFDQLMPNNKTIRKKLKENIY